ncbi:protein arginine N-methyltransferase 1.5 [Arabidopsis lyrata subsp. lyrata]|uniref:protein arginine N-methyltransferase 1.5 n=1 Tax=Arabidopsis lyrata subsp. lyrata TaxID=81972 RepID=UPI000A29BAE8|nr:protein arginine N-methyltransferase 1.5 [Arabidopsis lyrata subsp. lyrata]|eukprot:XP_020883503.1 protein arginine N-methyltransferase 1.5 [Arabidopsis lyrata subsp. lyrata]
MLDNLVKASVTLKDEVKVVKNYLDATKQKLAVVPNTTFELQQFASLIADSPPSSKWLGSEIQALNTQSCLLPTPKGTSCANYARCVNQILQRLPEIELWLRIPLKDSDTEDPKDYWEIWNSFRLLCDHDSKLFVALDVQSKLPSENALGRWFGDLVKAAIISTECFAPTTQHPILLKNHRELITRLFHHNVQAIVSGKPLCNLQTDSVDITEGQSPLFLMGANDMQMHPNSRILTILVLCSSIWNHFLNKNAKRLSTEIAFTHPCSH